MASLHINWPGQYVVIDAIVAVGLDGFEVAKFSFVQGGSIELSLTPGTHVVSAKIPIRKAKEFRVDVQGDRRYSLELVYSTIWGNFSDQAKFFELAHDPVSPSIQSVESWLVAIDGQQFGPYDKQTLQMLVATNQLNVDNALVWKDGMSDWVEYRLVPELQASTTTEVVKPTEVPILATVVGNTHFDKNSVKDVQVVGHDRIELNSASLDELLTLPAITLQRAERLIVERKSRLGFQSIEEVARFLTLAPHQVERLRERVDVLPYSGLGPATSARGRIVDF